MSDVIARMRLESQDFDNKLKSATANLQYMEREVRRTGATFEYADKEELDFLQSLGQMETKAMDAKGKIKELSNSYKELAMLYERMTDAEKASIPGKTLAASLQQIKQRLNDTKANFAKVSSEIGEGVGGLGGALDQLAGKIGVPTQLLTKMGLAAAAVGTAIKIGTDALKNNEELLDDWSATVESAQATYDGFLTALNTGDISGFLSRLGKISKAAREAYQALDKLGTFNAFNQINLQRAQTNFTETIASYREGNADKSDVRAAADAWQQQLELRRKDEMDAYLAKIKELAAKKGVDADLLTKALSGSYGDYEALKETQMPTKSVYNSSTRTFNDVTDFDAATEVQKLGQALRQLNDTELQSIQGLGRQAESTKNEIAQIDKQVVRLLGNSANSPKSAASSKATGSGLKMNSPAGMPEIGSIADLEAQAATVRNSMSGATNAAEYKEMEDHLNNILAKIREIKGEGGNVELTFSESGMADLGKQIKEKLSNLEFGSGDYLIATSNLVDFKTLQTLLSTAVKNGLDFDKEWFSSLFEDIKIGADVDPSEWQAVIDEINRLLQEKGLEPIKVNLDTGSLEESKQNVISAVDEMGEAIDRLSSGVGAISTIGNAFDDLKNIGEDLADAFSGEMDAWDALMTVFNSGIGIMETVIGVMEAINTLQGLANTLSDTRVAKQAAETTAVVTGKGSEMAATAAEASVSAAELGVDTADAAAKAGKAVAWIPIVGPALAAAAIAAIVGAIMSAQSQAKSAGKFASGGIVPGNSYSGDQLTASVNSGEVILNHAQSETVARQLTAGSPFGRIEIEGRISGTDILLAANNSNRSRGGSRGYYTKIH